VVPLPALISSPLYIYSSPSGSWLEKSAAFDVGVYTVPPCVKLLRAASICVPDGQLFDMS